MAAAGAGTGSSPDAALGGQEVRQGHGCTGGFSTAPGMTRSSSPGQDRTARGTGDRRPAVTGSCW